jgi:hypothetical protein
MFKQNPLTYLDHILLFDVVQAKKNVQAYLLTALTLLGTHRSQFIVRCGSSKRTLQAYLLTALTLLGTFH